MKSAWKGFLRTWAPLLPLSTWARCTGQALAMPFYHSCSDTPLPHLRHLYALRSPRQLEADLDYLLRSFQPIDLPQLIAYRLEGKPLPKRALWLSFDDGLRECATTIAPLLLRKGIPATFFINNQFVDNQDVMFRYRASWLIETCQTIPVDRLRLALADRLSIADFSDFKQAILGVKHGEAAFLKMLEQRLDLDFQAYCQRQPIYLSSEEIRSLIAQGFSIGSHSIDHPLYKDLDTAEQIRQTAVSQDYIHKTFEINYRVFAFPFSDDGVSKAFFEWSKSNFDLTFGTAGLKQETLYPRHFQRVAMETDRVESPQAIWGVEYAHYFFKRLLGKHRIQR